MNVSVLLRDELAAASKADTGRRKEHHGGDPRALLFNPRALLFHFPPGLRDSNAPASRVCLSCDYSCDYNPSRDGVAANPALSIPQTLTCHVNPWPEHTQSCREV